MNEGSIIVHAFSPQVQPSQSDSDVTREDAILLSQGRSVARGGCCTIGWQTPNVRYPEECLINNAFIYIPTPPLVPTAAALATCTIKEWDTRLPESESFFTADLEPFGSTLFCSQHSCPPAVPKKGRNRSDSSSPGRPPTKRKKLEEDTGPLDELVPLPHYIPAPLKSSHPAVPLDVPPFFVPVPPQTESSIEALFSSIYSRVAWLIPVRGLPPWEDVSRGRVALSDISVPLLGHGHLSTSSNPDVVWTYASFRQFWTFLRSCSETSGSVTGPLSLSFWAAPRSDPTGTQRGSESSASPAYLTANRETEITPSDHSLLAPIAISVPKSRLTDIDYVKVYCDAPRAMLVRRTLGEWAYKDDGQAEDLGNPVEAIRILEFAKLVLVNERGEGVLIS